MRYVQTKYLKSGQKLASDLMLSKNKLMLRRGIPLTDALIRRVRLQGFAGLYIDDDISKGLYVSDVISDKLKTKTTAELQAFFHFAASGGASGARAHTKILRRLAVSIADEIEHDPRTMVNAIDMRPHEEYQHRHSLSVAVLSVVIGTVIGLGRSALRNLALGALVHDIGKTLVPAEVRDTAGRLSAGGFERMKRHCELGFDYLVSHTDLPESAVDVALHHHENYDGSGYPAGLSGEAIPVFSRIVAAADVYDSLTSDLPYRKAVLPSDAIEYVMSGYNSLFDPSVVNALLQCVAPYPVGTCVRLSSGDMGIVVKNRQNAGLRPLVRLIRENTLTDEVLDLAEDRSTLNITIREIIPV